MAKASTARQERVAREEGPAQVRAAATQPVSASLDRLIHERIRLGIVSALAVNRSLTFNELKALLKTTDGNRTHAAEILGISREGLRTKMQRYGLSDTATPPM